MASSYFSMGSSFNVIMILQIGKCRKMEMELRKECYEVGALLYCPALNAKLADAVMMNRFGKQYSLAICLEDTIGDESVEKAEKQLLETLTKITDATTKKGKKEFFLPKIFIRVREPEQLQRIYDLFGSAPGTIRKDTDGGGKVVARHLPQNKMQFLVMQGKSEKWLQHSFVVSDNVIAKLLEQGRTAVLLYTPSLAMQPAKRMRLVPV